MNSQIPDKKSNKYNIRKYNSNIMMIIMAPMVINKDVEVSKPQRCRLLSTKYNYLKK